MNRHLGEEVLAKDLMQQGKLFQRSTNFLYCSVLSLGGNVNTKTDVEA